MSRRISDNRLELIHIQLALRVKTNKDLKGAIMNEVDVREYACIVEELRRRRRSLGAIKYGELTLKLAAMAVGDKIVIPPRSQSSITTCRKSARGKLKISDARWHCTTLPSGEIEIERRPDGEPHIFGKPPNPLIAQLAGMNLNGRLKIECPKSYYHKVKVLARQKAGNPRMNWRATNFSNGTLRIIRTR